MRTTLDLDAHLLTLARRSGVRLVTFDAAVAVLAHGCDVDRLTTL
jgi:predicted nucleic acid-binding protein